LQSTAVTATDASVAEVVVAKLRRLDAGLARSLVLDLRVGAARLLGTPGNLGPGLGPDGSFGGPTGRATRRVVLGSLRARLDVSITRWRARREVAG
jgi:hypothetical protein